MRSGRLAFPRQIKVEVTGVAHPDAPGVWVEGVFPHIRPDWHEADLLIVREVMASPARRVVDPNKAREDGDPFLLALALQLQREGYEVCVVTGESRDKADHIAMTTAGRHLGLAVMGLEDFMAAAFMDSS